MILPIVVNFIVLVLVLYLVTRKPVAKMFVDRSEAVGTLMIEAEKMSEESQKLLNEWEGNWKASAAHAKTMMDETKAALARVREKTLEKAKHDAERIGQEAKAVGETEKVRASQALQKELATKSVSLASQYLASHLGDDDRKKLVSEYTEIVANGSSR